MNYTVLSLYWFAYYLIVSVYVESIPIPIDNAGFENDFPNCTDEYFSYPGVSDWTLYDPYDVNSDSWSPHYICPKCPNCKRNEDLPFNDAVYGDGAPQGNSVLALWTTQDQQGAFGVEQTLAATLVPNALYTLSVKVGNPGNNYWFSTDAVGWPGYIVQLLADNEVLAEDKSSIFVPDQQWRNITVRYETSSTDPMIGKQIKIRLMEQNDESIASNDYQGWIAFDDVLLTAVTITTTTTATPTETVFTETESQATGITNAGATTTTGTLNVASTNTRDYISTYVTSTFSTDTTSNAISTNLMNTGNDNIHSTVGSDTDAMDTLHIDTTAKYVDRDENRDAGSPIDVSVPTVILFAVAVVLTCIYFITRSGNKIKAKYVTDVNAIKENQANHISVVSASQPQCEMHVVDVAEGDAEQAPNDLHDDPPVYGKEGPENKVTTAPQHPNMEPDEFEVIGDDDITDGNATNI